MAKHIPEQDLALSGPKVWPRLCADEAVDRFIFRRPEIGYLRARRKILAYGPNELTTVNVKVSREWQNGPRRQRETIGGFTHQILPNPLEDVQQFLRELRPILIRRLPDKPLPGISVYLRFINPDIKKPIATFQEKWL